ncbi:MAG: hypothetical protein QGG54_18125, partial [Gammaproteobacteria bacterium]|nr:hypothetical protein [Gammaproteobacteria bacterium]
MLKLESTSNQSLIQYKTADGSGGWANPSGDQGAAIAIVPRTGRNHCLEMTNINAGGDFAVSAPASGINLALGAMLEFEYRIPQEVKINLYLQLSGAVSPFESADRIAGKQWHFVQLTGSGDSNENLKSLGHIRDAQADGKWRHAEFDLYASLKKLYPSSSVINIEQLWFGNRHKGYIQAGLAGNQAGLQYWLDNFKIWSEGGQAGEIELTVTGSDGGKVADLESVVHWFSNRPESAVPEGSNKVLFKTEGTTDTEARAVSFDSGKIGSFYLNVAGTLVTGIDLPVISFPLRIAAPSSVERISPKARSEWGGQPVLIKSNGRTFPQAVQISVAGSTYNSAHQNVEADAAARQIRFSLPSKGHTFASGQRIPFKLNFGDEVIEWEYVWSYQKDKALPTLVKLDQLLVDADFENDFEGWTRYGKQHGALLVR